MIFRVKPEASTWECAISSTAAGRMYQGMEYTGFLFDTSSKIELYSHALFIILSKFILYFFFLYEPWCSVSVISLQHRMVLFAVWLGHHNG